MRMSFEKNLRRKSNVTVDIINSTGLFILRIIGNRITHYSLMHICIHNVFDNHNFNSLKVNEVNV